MIDGFLHKGLRQKLVETIKMKGITNSLVIAAIGKIPRHYFVESYLESSAYEDRALPIGAGQTISQPYTVAYQTELLNVGKRAKVLEIGTGSGYQTAVLLEIGVQVFTIERQRELYMKTCAFLPNIGYNAQFFYGDGYEGKPTYGPFDGILITAGAPFIPEKLLLQLKIGGKFVAPIGNQDFQVMTVVERISDTEYKKTEHGNFVFVPMLKGTSK